MNTTSNPSEPEGRRPKHRLRKWLVALAVLAGLILFLWDWDFVLFPQEQTSTVLLFDNCDDDFRTPPFEDAVIAFRPRGASSRMITNLNQCQTVGGHRSLAVSPDGRFFVICEEVGKHLTAYETETGKRLWSLDGEFTSATVASNGNVYAVISSGTIYGDRTAVIDGEGRMTHTGSAAGCDIALDPDREVLWLVGKYIKKCDLSLNVLREIDPIKWCAVSVDVNPDGSIWAAERDHPDVAQSTNRILKVSPGGLVLKSVYLGWDPLCVRVDRSDASVWVTGLQVHKPVTGRILEAVERRTGALPIGKKFRDFLTRIRVTYKTQKYDADGKLLVTLNRGGCSIDIQQSDGSVWLAGKDKVYWYSREGKKLARLGGVSADQKYIAVVPEPAPAPADRR